MNNDILDKIEKKASYYDRSFAALKLALFCFVSLLLLGILSLYSPKNDVFETVFGLLFFILFGGILTYGLSGIVNSTRSLVKKEDYGVRRIIVLIISLIILLLPFLMIIVNIMDIMRAW